jgi:hypothetical protein
MNHAVETLKIPQDHIDSFAKSLHHHLSRNLDIQETQRNKKIEMY